MAVLEEKTKFHIDNYYLDDPKTFGDLTLWQVGRRFLEPNAIIGEHLHGELFELTIATGGSATVYMGGVPKKVKRGDIFLSFPNEVHDIIYSLMKEIIVFTLRDFAKAERRTANVAAPDILCQNVMSYVDTHIYSITSLIEVAQHFKYNYSYLSSLFKRTTGNTLSDYYRIRRLEVARGLIEEGKKNVSEISELLGYSTPFAFSAAFKKHFGTSPNFYKSQKPKTNTRSQL